MFVQLTFLGAGHETTVSGLSCVPTSVKLREVGLLILLGFVDAVAISQ